MPIPKKENLAEEGPAHPMCVRPSRPVRSLIEELAVKERRSQNTVTVMLLEEALKARGFNPFEQQAG